MIIFSWRRNRSEQRKIRISERTREGARGGEQKLLRPDAIRQLRELVMLHLRVDGTKLICQNVNGNLTRAIDLLFNLLSPKRHCPSLLNNLFLAPLIWNPSGSRPRVDA